jgi:hypothetical protein
MLAGAKAKFELSTAMKIYYITAWRYNPEDLDFYQGV